MATLPNPIYTGTPVYATPGIPQMTTATTAYVPSPYTPIIAAQQTPGYYPAMGAMQMNGQPAMIQQQPYPVYQQRDDCCDCCYGDCNRCCWGIFAALCICCFCCEEEGDECCC